MTLDSSVGLDQERYFLAQAVTGNSLTEDIHQTEKAGELGITKLVVGQKKGLTLEKSSNQKGIEGLEIGQTPLNHVLDGRIDLEIDQAPQSQPQDGKEMVDQDFSLVQVLADHDIHLGQVMRHTLLQMKCGEFNQRQRQKILFLSFLLHIK